MAKDKANTKERFTKQFKLESPVDGLAFINTMDKAWALSLRTDTPCHVKFHKLVRVD